MGNTFINETLMEMFSDILPTENSVVLESTSEQYIPDSDYMLESAGNTYLIRDRLYPLIENALRDPSKEREFSKLISNYIDRNSDKLHTVGPVHLIPFTNVDKENFFRALGLDPKEVIKLLVSMTNEINDAANWKGVRQNPIFAVFYCCIRYYTLHPNTAKLNQCLIIYALAQYPSVFSNTFKFGTNPAVMQYTINNLSAKFKIKQEGHVFGMLNSSIQSSYQFLKPYFKDGSDKEMIRFISRIRNDQKSLMRKIGNEYYSNHEKGLAVTTSVDRYDNDELIDDTSNNTSIVEEVSSKVILGITVNGIDMARCQVAARYAQISFVDLRFYLTKILIDKNTESLAKIIQAILTVFLYEERCKPSEINDKKFLGFAINLFRRTNSSNANIKTIKDTLNNWGEESGVHAKFSREASRVNYKKAIFMYLIMSIQHFNK